MKQKARRLTRKQREDRAIDTLIALCLHPRFAQINALMKAKLQKKPVDESKWWE